MKEQMKNSVKGALLAATLLMPQAARAQEDQSKDPIPATSPGTSLTVPSVDLSTLKTPDAQKVSEIPPRILEAAAKMGLDPADIKLESGVWVACKGETCTPIDKALPGEGAKQRERLVLRGLHQGDTLTITEHPITTHRIERPNYGIPGLGTFSRQSDGSVTFEADATFKGTVEPLQAKASGGTATAPQNAGQREPQGVTRIAQANSPVHKAYSAAYLKELGEILAKQDTTVVLVVSVPNLCGPCRIFKGDVTTAAKGYAKGDKVRFATIDFTSFEEARRVMGPIRSFPATFVFPALPGQDEAAEAAPDRGTPKLPFIQNVDRPYEERFGRMPAGPLREFIRETSQSVGQIIKDMINGL
ncbi:MAG: Thioredoxin [Pseudomonadota bacterium]|jgi:hypothetical protein